MSGLPADNIRNSDTDIIDAHIHLWSTDLDRYPLALGFTTENLWRESYTPEDHEISSGKYGALRANLVQMTWYGLDHSYITDLIQAHPGRFVGTGIVPAVTDISLPSPGRVMEALSSKGIFAFRIRGRSAQSPWGQSSQWLDQEGYAEMFATGASQNLALSFLAGPTDLPEIDRMCALYPDTPVIIDHVGGVRVKDAALVEQEIVALTELARHPRLMIKFGPIHGLGRDEAPFTDVLRLLQRTVEAFGAERCMWESDSGGPIEPKNPRDDMIASIALIRKAEFLTQSEQRLILSGTAEAFFFNR
jgi:predicted TIM-barrel fold metal-dependent hydrolase